MSGNEEGCSSGAMGSISEGVGSVDNKVSKMGDY